MKRIWIHFTERLADAITAEAKQRGIPMSEVVRQGMANRYSIPHESVEIGKKYRVPELDTPA